MAVYHTGLGREGPGLLLRDIRAGAADVLVVRDALLALRPDAVLLLDLDFDLDRRVLSALSALLADGGHPMHHTFAPRPNTGRHTGLDMDGDGRLGTPDDAQGYGEFSGAGGMALLSRFPIDRHSLVDFSDILWRDLPGSRQPVVAGLPFPSIETQAVQRLSTTNHWEVALQTPGGPLTVMAWHAGPPAFGGPHGRNRARNADETAFWLWRLQGGLAPVPRDFVLMGGANLDPEAGDGHHATMRTLLAHPLLQDPAPETVAEAGRPASRTTARWENRDLALRVEYLLPSVSLRVLESGLIWPSESARHALVWADVVLPDVRANSVPSRGPSDRAPEHQTRRNGKSASRSP